MKQFTLIAAVASTVALAVGVAAHRQDGLTVHEWGTFLSMNGSDGVALDGMYHEEHALPAFVHSRSKDQMKLPTSMLKGETPVIYFYSASPLKASVEVDFPSGIWTQWYPQATRVGPSLAATHEPLNLRGGRIRWDVEIVPRLSETAIPPAPSDALWNHSRKVDSAYVRVGSGGSSGNEVDRFIFYRGLGRAELPVQFAASGNGAVSCSASIADPVRHLFIIRVENGRGALRYYGSLSPGQELKDAIPSMESAEPVEKFSVTAGNALAERLEESGLFEKEARAMVNTWRSSYLETDGIRALYVLPRVWTDRFIPMKIEPNPTALVRVMVARTELLTPERERAAEAAIRDLASPDSQKRQSAFEFIAAQGRYVEPVIRRTLITTRDESVRTTCRRLLLTPFVTELRTSLKDARGQKTFHTPVYSRALLAQLLRDSGLDAQASSEGKAVLQELNGMRQPPMNNHDARHYLRASARASEALGDASAALNWYGKFIKFAAQPLECGSGCHALEGPRDRRFFRDWWAGARFAKMASKAGRSERLISELERALKERPSDSEARLSLGYLYAESGATGRSREMFSQLEGTGRKTAVRQESR